MIALRPEQQHWLQSKPVGEHVQYYTNSKLLRYGMRVISQVKEAQKNEEYKTVPYLILLACQSLGKGINLNNLLGSKCKP